MRRPSAALKDCGPYGRMTVRQMAKLAGIHENTMYGRLSHGLTPQQAIEYVRPKPKLGKPAWTLDGMRTSGTITIAAAVRIARMFPDKPPSVKVLQERLGVCRATAYRWRAAFID